MTLEIQSMREEIQSFHLSKFDQVRAIYKRRSPCQDTANVTTIVKDFTMFLADKFEFLSFRYGKRKCKLN